MELRTSSRCFLCLWRSRQLQRVGRSDSKQTFSDELLNPIDVGVAFGFYADNGKMVFGIGGEFGLTETNGKNFSVSGGTVHTRNTFLSVGYLF